MSAILKMKSLVTQKPWSTFSSSSRLPQSLFSSAPKSAVLRDPQSSLTLRNPNLLRLKPTLYLRRASLCLARSRGLQTESVTRPVSGEIHVIVGPMFAGKTTTLLRRVQSERSNGRNVAIIKSNKDTRYGLDSIVTHDGLKLPCWAIADLSSFRQKIGIDAYEQLDLIGIDEAQFFEGLYDFCREAADHDGKTLIVSGLDGDYLRRSFGSVLDIIPLADSVTKLSSRCELCGKNAFFTLRKSQETQTELIGGAEVYMPVCRQHYVSGQVVIEATRVALESQVHSTSYVL